MSVAACSAEAPPQPEPAKAENVASAKQAWGECELGIPCSCGWSGNYATVECLEGVDGYNVCDWGSCPDYSGAGSGGGGYDDPCAGLPSWMCSC